jgi:hypothetical protein
MTATQEGLDLSALKQSYWQQGYIVLCGLFSPAETEAWPSNATVCWSKIGSTALMCARRFA